MQLSDFDYQLPQELIAQHPLQQRDACRLLVVDTKNGHSNRQFADVVNYLAPGDCLVLNDTKVIPARLMGQTQTGVFVEFLLLKRISVDRWEVALRPGRRCKIGTKVHFSRDSNCNLQAVIEEIVSGGNRIVRFEYDGIFEQVLETLGEIPLPHYITQKLRDNSSYQTVYAVNDGSAAAPTAGLHFTEQLLSKLRDNGVIIEFITLHVGLGTFRPVKTEKIADHIMHSEYFEIPTKTAQAVNLAKQNGGKVVAVGTTVTRALEAATINSELIAMKADTNIFITPGYKFKIVDGLITNFHLPKSTLLMLVSALAGRERILDEYEYAISQKYRFFSFGDAMIIL